MGEALQKRDTYVLSKTPGDRPTTMAYHVSSAVADRQCQQENTAIRICMCTHGSHLHLSSLQLRL